MSVMEFLSLGRDEKVLTQKNTEEKRKRKKNTEKGHTGPKTNKKMRENRERSITRVPTKRIPESSRGAIPVGHSGPGPVQPGFKPLHGLHLLS